MLSWWRVPSSQIFIPWWTAPQVSCKVCVHSGLDCRVISRTIPLPHRTLHGYLVASLLKAGPTSSPKTPRNIPGVTHRYYVDIFQRHIIFYNTTQHKHAYPHLLSQYPLHFVANNQNNSKTPSKPGVSTLQPSTLKTNSSSDKVSQCITLRNST